MLTAPYGTWPSAVSAADLTAGVVGLSRGTVDGGRLYWSESLPDQGGRTTLWRQEPDGSRVELTPGANVRTAVNEYGGGDWAVAGGILVYSTHPDHDVCVIEHDAPPRVLARGGALRFGGLALDPVRRLVLAVREDHTASDRECRTTLVALALDSAEPDGGRVLAEGADFYAGPAIGPDGLLAWVEWNHPNLPWDTTTLAVTRMDNPSVATRVAGGAEESVLYPSWEADGSLVFLSDASGFWNFHRWDGRRTRPLHEHPWDFCGPMWRLEPPPYSLLGDGRIGCSWLVDGISRFGVLTPGQSPEDGRIDTLASAAVTVSLTGHGTDVLALFGYPDRPTELHRVDLNTGSSMVVRRSAESRLDRDHVSQAISRSWAGPDGDVHAWYYPPTNPLVTAPLGELPPLQVWSHGGPTGLATPEFRPALQYWTSRGFAILDVNYAGSSGYGRAYRKRLDRQWGVADVRDCIDGALGAVHDGLADSARLSIRGSSAGGYTTLQALVSSTIFSAGISLYGIGDLEALESQTHKFESHYTQNLVATYPEGREVYLARSPIHHLDRLNCPMLILQGTQDTVVPPEQAHAMAAAVRAKGLPLAVLFFDGEGHGFRRADTIIATAEASLSFLAQIHGFTPAGDLPRLEIENLAQSR